MPSGRPPSIRFRIVNPRSTVRVAAGLELALALGVLLGDLQGLLWILIFEYALRLFAPDVAPLLWFGGRATGGTALEAGAPPRARWFGRLAVVVALTVIPGERYALCLAVGGALAAELALDAATGRSLLESLLSPLRRRPSGVVARIDRALTRILRAPIADRRARLRTVMALLGVTLGIGLGLIGLKVYAYSLGIRIPIFINDEGYWMPETDIGYRNRDDIARWSYLTEWQQTTGGGFKRREPISPVKPEGVTRIIGVGDSVTWGIGAAQTNTYLGMLERILNPAMPCETINGGVIGYSSFQEMKFIEKYVLPLEPDVVLVNYCTRDVLPTEDPFGLGRDILVRHLRSLEQEHVREEEREAFDALIGLFEKGAVWAAYKESPESVRRLAFRLLVEESYRGMAGLCRSRGARLVVLLIPPEVLVESYVVEAERLMKIFDDEGIEYLDLMGAMKRESSSGDGRESATMRLRLPFRNSDLQAIRLFEEYRWMHEREKYIDYYHPSRKGNRIVAEHVARFLLQH